jgi:hypothetical protein
MVLFCGQVVSQIADKVSFVLLSSLAYSYQWTTLWSQTELFDFPIKQLLERYGLARNAVYLRMKRLNIIPHTPRYVSWLNHKIGI